MWTPLLSAFVHGDDAHIYMQFIPGILPFLLSLIYILRLDCLADSTGRGCNGKLRGATYFLWYHFDVWLFLCLLC